MQSTSMSSTSDSIGSSTASSSVNDSTPLWEYVVMTERSGAGGNKAFICNFCKASFKGSYFRVKAHLLKITGQGIKICDKVTHEEVGRLKKLQDEADLRANRVPPHSDGEISSMRNQCIKRLFPNNEERRRVQEEFVRFSICGDGFDIHDSIADRGVVKPLDWWVTYGGAAPNLQSVALKLLSQPSSSSCCERNWKTYSLIHDAKRNQMTPKRAEDLVFVHSNLRLLSRRSPQYSTGESRFWDVAGDAHEPFDGAEQLAIASLSLDEPEYEMIVFGDNV